MRTPLHKVIQDVAVSVNVRSKNFIMTSVQFWMVTELELFEYANTKPLWNGKKKIEITVIYIFILIQCFNDKILAQKWHLSQLTTKVLKSHTNRKVHYAWQLVFDNMRPWRNSPQIRTATVRNTADSLTIQGTTYSAFQLRCTEFLSCHSLDVAADADLLCNKDIALGTTIKETLCNAYTAMWHKHWVCNNFRKCDSRYHSVFLNDAGVQAVPLQAWTGPMGVPGGWGSQNFYIIGTWRRQGRQPYAPASFTPRINEGLTSIYG